MMAIDMLVIGKGGRGRKVADTLYLDTEKYNSCSSWAFRFI